MRGYFRIPTRIDLDIIDLPELNCFLCPGRPPQEFDGASWVVVVGVGIEVVFSVGSVIFIVGMPSLLVSMLGIGFHVM